MLQTLGVGPQQGEVPLHQLQGEDLHRSQGEDHYHHPQPVVALMQPLISASFLLLSVPTNLLDRPGLHHSLVVLPFRMEEEARDQPQEVQLGH